MANTTLDFFNDPDQDSRRAELRDFFGPNADVFLRSYDRQRALAVGPKSGRSFFESLRVNGFEAAAFFCGPVWFFYRKLWAWAWGITVFEFAFGWLASVLHLRGSFAFGAVLAVSVYRIYVTHAITKLTAMRAAGGTLDPAAVRAAGGVSKLAGWISGSLYFFLLVLVVVGFVLLIMHPDGANTVNP